ncbi:hypothetical protein BGZ61DRAFT_91698 [Ilyonectria robusta]|uniref:uncharacterized protein n=1 Tax=Ilyonectria robusta TaxID=1079257 RepID=UPI001E8CC956|nr:uncharacterized protein BGZ61DRAFT_91698 [Ilyonectria robusta]KAH8736166.1 hypothetical protein BGZ61DRAFT_91698 [Ilyonectria robusta]
MMGGGDKEEEESCDEYWPMRRGLEPIGPWGERSSRGEKKGERQRGARWKGKGRLFNWLEVECGSYYGISLGNVLLGVAVEPGSPQARARRGAGQDSGQRPLRRQRAQRTPSGQPAAGVGRRTQQCTLRNRHLQDAAGFELARERAMRWKWLMINLDAASSFWEPDTQQNRQGGVPATASTRRSKGRHLPEPPNDVPPPPPSPAKEGKKPPERR